MPEKYYLGIDQGTTGTAALILNSNLEVISQGYADYKLLYPKPGWVEHNPIDIWNAVLDAVLQACNAANIKPAQLECIGIDHDRQPPQDRGAVRQAQRRRHPGRCHK